MLQRLPKDSQRIRRLVAVASLVLSTAVLVTIGVALWHSRQDAWARAELSGANFTRTFAEHVQRYIDLNIASLTLIAGELEDPEFRALSPQAKHRLLAAASDGSTFVTSILVLDADGNIAIDSAPRPRVMNLAFRDYFSVHAGKPDAGLFISDPFRSQIADDAWSIAISRRLNHDDGSFAGVAVVIIRLAFAQSFIEKMGIGPRDAIGLINERGIILARYPSSNGEGDVGKDMAGSPNTKRVLSAPSGSFIARAALDNVQRLITFTRVGGQPFVVAAALSTDMILAEWRRRALIIGAAAVLISVALVLVALALERELRRRSTMEAELAMLAVTDPLTGLANRRRFDEVIGREWDRVQRTGGALSLLMIDVDHFKRLNDRYGHAVGDDMLKVIASALRQSARRPSDLCARHGGEEFAMILPDTEIDGAAFMAERVRVQLARSAMPLANQVRIATPTVSIGIATKNGSGFATLDDFLVAADRAVYAAKDAGRNRAEMAS